VTVRSDEDRDLRLIFEGAAAGIVVTTPDGRFDYANPTFERMLGYSLAELRKLDFLSLTHPDDRERVLGRHEALLAGQIPSFVLEKRSTRRDGQVLWLRISVSLLPGPEGTPSRAVAVIEDITERKGAAARLQENERLLGIAGRMAQLGGWLVDLEAGLCHWSDEVCRIHEVSKGTVVTTEEGIRFYAPEWRPVIEAHFRRCAEEGVPYDLDLQIETAGGRRVWVRTIGEAIRDPDGVIRRVQGAFQDISRQKEAEEALVESRASFHQLAESMPIFVWSATPDGQIDYVTRDLMEYTGEPLEAHLNGNWLEFIHPEDRERVRARWVQSLATASPYLVETRIRRRDGAQRWHLVQAQAVRGRDGSIRAWYGSSTDIHDLRLVEARADRLQERLGRTLESITDAFYLLDDEWRFVFMNGEGERLARSPRSELLGRPVWEVFPELVGSELEAHLREGVGQGVPVQALHHFEPYDVWVDVRAYPSSDGVAIYVQNVTSARIAELKLRAAEERFRNVVRATTDAIWDWDLRTDRVWWSEGLLESFGVEPVSLDSGTEAWVARIHPSDRDRAVLGLRAAIDGGSDIWQDQYRFLRGDGSYAWVRDRGFIMRDRTGAPVRVVGGIADETGFVEAQQKIQEQVELLDRAQDAIFVVDLEHRAVFWNAGAQRAYGWSAAEVEGQSVRDLLHPDPAEYDAARAAVLETGEWSGEISHRRRDGAGLLVEGRWSLVRDEDGDPQRILAINTDITERKALLNQFLRAQRMESIGTLAGGIAHDLNNVLAPILLAVDLLREDPLDEEVLETLATIERSADRGAELVRKVLAFARGVEGDQVAVDLTRILDDLVQVVRDTFPRTVRLRVELSEDLRALRGDPTQLHQVLMNLVLNARDAMPKGGELTIVAENVDLDEQFTAMAGEGSAGPYLRISVEDTGEGIPAEVLDKIFEPFFTTKELGRGTGLGLSTVAAIVRSHGGFVHVKSEPGKGSTFQVYLPAGVESVEETMPVPPRTLPRGGGELVLVVDDEPAVRAITRRTLEAHGYRVMTAADGTEAVSAFALHGEDIAVVLTDIVMPVMDGPETIRALRRMDPTVRVVTASGYGGETGIARAADAGCKHFLPKPYTAKALVRKIREALTDPAPGADPDPGETSGS